MAVFLLLLAALIYFVPSIMALTRRHGNSGAILCLNALLGWTVLGWIGALIWSCTNNGIKFENPAPPRQIDPLPWERKIVLLLLANTIGFLSPSICYYLGIFAGMISASNPDFDPAAFRLQLVPGIMMTWAVCAAFSPAFFFIKDDGRWVFLLAPILVPIFYGFSVL